MRAVLATKPGGPEVLSVHDVPEPTPGPGEVLLEVAAAGVNRADLMQRMGRYPPPPGVTDILGLEASGVIAQLGAGVGDTVGGWAIGDQACALLAGGAYAERVVVPAGQLLPIPGDGTLDLITAATLPEVAATVWSNLFMVAHLRPGDSLLVHGGAGGIGSFAIQLATALGARVLATAGSQEKLALCRELGAVEAINYREADFVEEVRRVTGDSGELAGSNGPGVDVILDNMGAKYLGRNVAALATSGRLVVIGLQGGTTGELDLSKLLAKRGAVIATSLRSRPLAEKSAICAALIEHVWPLIADGRVRPMLRRTFAMDEAAAAHEYLDSGSHTGKIALSIADVVSRA